jgi:hypothetical protein
MSNRLCWALAALLVASNVAWAYAMIDQSVTLEHQTTEMTHRGDQVAVLTGLMVTYP